jgi:hypothetical protein
MRLTSQKSEDSTPTLSETVDTEAVEAASIPFTQPAFVAAPVPPPEFTAPSL